MNIIENVREKKINQIWSKGDSVVQQVALPPYSFRVYSSIFLQLCATCVCVGYLWAFTISFYNLQLSCQ